MYNIKGTSTGSNTFDLNDWQTGVGGNWQRWYVINGVWQSAATSQISCTPVPVTLIAFDAKRNKQGVLLQWQTVTEMNSSHFNVQKSKDGINFEILAGVRASGNSDQLK